MGGVSFGTVQVSAHQHVHDILGRVLSGLLKPSAKRFEGAFPTLSQDVLEDVVDEKHRRGVAIEVSDDGPEAFLSCGVPYLQFDGVGVVDLDHL